MITKTYSPEKKLRNSMRPERKLETGFPSPAADHIENRLNLHEHLVKYPASTFFVKIEGDQENGLGLHHGDILIIDRSLAPRHKSLVIAECEGEHVVCRLVRNKHNWILERADGNSIDLNFDELVNPAIWGKVSYVIHEV